MYPRCITKLFPVHLQRTSRCWGLFLMKTVQQWTGRTACALQAALRMTNEAFAAHLGTAVRTVATWHQKPERVPSAEMQQALDTTLELAGEGAQARFAMNVADTGSAPEPPVPMSEGSAHVAENETASAADDRRTAASSTITLENAEGSTDGSMDGSVSTSEQQDYARRLIAAGERLLLRAGEANSVVIEGEALESHALALPSCAPEPHRES
jgi:hypothetical protein